MEIAKGQDKRECVCVTASSFICVCACPGINGNALKDDKAKETSSAAGYLLFCSVAIQHEKGVRLNDW